ncbi:MAG: TonB-dependent receptor [Pseudomonadales bacterium]|nr:TonB-dependent receptor [Pseudomonadales bacterium]
MTNAGSAGGVIEEVVVTGSYIRGTQEDGALPVDIITAESLGQQGNPNIIQLIQRIPSMSGGNIGESNRFLGNQAQGSATVNLRGLGLTRTLPLLNGQRMARHTAAGGQEFVDVSQIPFAAIGQVEVLRDGAAVIYGSDAVAGVVNFITRRDLEGFEFSGSFTSIDDSAGDWDASIAYGWNNDSGNVLLVADYARKDEIRLFDFEFMKPLPPGQGDGISLAGNPGTYFTIGSPVDIDGDGFFEPGTTQGSAFRDLGCLELGAAPIPPVSCTYPFVWQESPINDEERFHLFGEVNWEFSDTLRFHLESYFAKTLIPNNRVSVTLSSTQFPTPIEASGGSPGGGSSPFPAVGGERQSRFYIPADNPGLVSLMTDGGCPYAQALCDSALASGVITSQTGWRPRALGGSPLFNGDTDPYRNETTAWRISGGFDGDLPNGWGWTTRLTYARFKGESEASDLSVTRVQLGLRGLGGEGCDPNTGTPGVGPCEWFNPFANSITRSVVNGLSYEEATGRPLSALNSAELWGWMREVQKVTIEADLLTAEAVLTGDFGETFRLPAGQIDWVLGAQWRYESRTVSPSNNANPFSTPCVDSPPYGDGFPTCTVPGVGPLLFNGQTNPSDVDRDVPSVFGELRVPLLERLELGIAGRYEDYSGTIGSTADYRLSLRWEPLNWLVLRGSTGTTFRAPPQAAVTPGSGRIQAQFSNPTSGAQLYRPVDVFGNPGLKPETADTMNLGAVISTDDLQVGGWNIGRFNLMLDYFNVTFQKEIATETAARVYGAMFPAAAAGGANPANWRCNIDELRERFTFTTSLNTNAYVYPDGSNYPECHPDNFLGITTNIVNAREDTEITGYDISLNWMRDDVFSGVLSVGANASYLDEWKRGDQYLLGTNLVFDAATDRASTAELLSAFFSYPDWRGNAHINYGRDRHNVRLMAHYYAGVKDRNRNMEKRDDHMTYDLVYQVELPWRTVVTATITNLFDEEPPYIRSQFNYDYMTYSPLGRTYKIGLRWNFGGGE